jgi:recombination protein RecA
MVISGEITEIVGRRSAGRTSLLLACLADATRAGGIGALIDGDDALDVESAARAGVELSRLLWVRCGQARRQAALRAVDMLARCRGFAVVAWDVGDRPPRLPLALAFRLKLAARQSGAALLIVSPRRVAGAAASLAVEAERQGTRWEGSPPLPARLAGARMGLKILRARGAPTRCRDESWELLA